MQYKFVVRIKTLTALRAVMMALSIRIECYTFFNIAADCDVINQPKRETMNIIKAFTIIVILISLSDLTLSLSQCSKATNKCISESIIPTTATTIARRNLFQKTFLTTATTFTFLSSQNIPNANALEKCRAKARNCIRTMWTAPADMKKEQAIRTIQDVLNSYPQNGQGGVDCNGWTIVNDSLSSPSKSSIELEFRSCVGPAALAINLAQPFIDDVILEFDSIEEGQPVSVQVKSSSRMGSSDLFVNKKRIEYLGDKLRQQGWIIPDVKYGA